jgi:hypothetical protein
MLEPRDRTLLTTALRPPVGYELDFVVGTSYSLDLLTLLTIPLSFAWFDQADLSETERVQSIEVLGSLQKFARRMAVFCQAGYIAWPLRRYPQLAFVEETVVECKVGNDGFFHPKAWVLRYRDADGHLAYRMLCMSRNLTTARSWDTILVLDGEVSQAPVAGSAPLADFIAALPGLAFRGMNEEKASATLRLAEELRKVEFAPPDGFDAFRFWPMGIDGHSSWPFGQSTGRFLVVSPFLGVTALDKIAGEGSILVSTDMALRELDRKPGGFTSFYTLDSRAVTEPIDEESAPTTDDPADMVQLSGLHAKLYVHDDGKMTRIWTGSANATHTAFNRSVEFLVELTGPRNRFGIDKLMAPGTESGLRDILIEADNIVAAEPLSEEQRTGERLLERARVWVATRALSLQVIERGEQYDVTLLAEQPSSPAPPDVRYRCWLNTLPADRSVPLPAGVGILAEFSGVSFEAITPFLGVEISTSVGGTTRSARFVLNLPMEGAPADRRERILRSLIGDKARFTRYLLMLLTDPSAWTSELAPSLTVDRNGESESTASLLDTSQPLFELLIRTLDRHPERLDDIERLLEGIRKGPEAEAMLPPGLEDIWKPIWSLRERMKEEARDA